MIRKSAALLACLIFTVFLASTGAQDVVQQPLKTASETLLISPADVAENDWRTVGAAPLGASVLYHLDNDRIWQQEQILSNLKQAHIATLRFPGGELADNYDWERHALEQPDAWPGGAASEAERNERTDYLEFLNAAEKLGVKHLFFVVNVDGAFRAPGDLEKNLKEYAEKAARWVKAANGGNQRVRYWEIGNEPSLYGNYPLSAEEYARALKVFSREMRAADPEILIGAAGPTGTDGIAFADRLTPRQLSEFRKKGGMKQFYANLGASQCVRKIQKEIPGRAACSPWWPTLLEQAGDSFDFAVIHRYTSINLAADSPRTDAFRLTQAPQRLRAYLEKARGKTTPIALTEWNTPNEKRNRCFTEIDHLLDIAVQIGNNAVGGVDFTHYWPLRPLSSAFKPLLTEDGRMTAVARLFGMAGEMLHEAQAAHYMPVENVYVLNVRRAGQEGVLIVNTGARPIPVELKIKDDAPKAELIVRRLIGNDDGTVKTLPEYKAACSKTERIQIEIPAKSITSALITY